MKFLGEWDFVIFVREKLNRKNNIKNKQIKSGRKKKAYKMILCIIKADKNAILLNGISRRMNFFVILSP